MLPPYRNATSPSTTAKPIVKGLLRVAAAPGITGGVMVGTDGMVSVGGFPAVVRADAVGTLGRPRSEAELAMPEVRSSSSSSSSSKVDVGRRDELVVVVRRVVVGLGSEPEPARHLSLTVSHLVPALQ